MVDAVRSALNAMGFNDVEILVAETGWPYNGDSNEAGPGVENARAYNGNLVAHLRSMVGTPLMPGKSVDTYIFALYDEDLKPGPASERSFGLFKPDLSMTYDIGLSKISLTPSTPKTPSPKPTKPCWCVPKDGVSDAQCLQRIHGTAISQKQLHSHPKILVTMAASTLVGVPENHEEVHHMERSPLGGKAKHTINEKTSIFEQENCRVKAVQFNYGWLSISVDRLLFSGHTTI
ncbi:GLYCOSYL HYDROLASE FAMILY 17 PROTEIN [Salix viminalis]|uniref:glucan endo-1,3-beta-D-glucosidase n=1 Tax=Salix viminalis TaxID=40686 RepID=A0A9Q0QK66_SALVM|nr:GLYCOSYL HYDROLASE FAMILY 17 PROTEIN [Salix viminalis]